MSKWKIPYISNITLEKENEINKEVRAELLDEQEKTERLRITFNNQTSKLRIIADYLYNHLNEELSYEQISKELNIPLSTIKIMVCNLNFYKGFPITMIPIPKKTGYIQSVLENEQDYEKWDKRKRKTITTMSVVRDKADKITSSKRKVKEKIKEEIEEKWN